MPASSALLTGSLKASLSTTATAIPLAFALIAVFMALTISATIEFCDPVHWNSVPSSADASWAPYWVGVKNGFVVTWQTNTNFHFGVWGNGNEPGAAPPLAAGAAALLLPPVHAVSRAVAAIDALARPVPASRRRRVTGLRSRVSTASSTLG